MGHKREGGREERVSRTPGKERTKGGAVGNDAGGGTIIVFSFLVRP
jgi:hypothetical protein